MFYGMNAWFLASLAMGALLWIAFAELPGWRALPGRQGAEAYAATMKRGGPVIAAMLGLSAVLGFIAAADDADAKWGVGAAFLAISLLAALYLALWPGKRIVEAAGESGSETAKNAALSPEQQAARVKSLLEVWAHLHFARLLVVATGVFFFIWASH